jgi:hypothetical protein
LQRRRRSILATCRFERQSLIIPDPASYLRNRRTTGNGSHLIMNIKQQR